MAKIQWKKQLNLILSRLDESCMAIVIGSNRQIDNLYLNKYNNGLTTLFKQTNETHPELKMFAIELEKAVRGKFAQFTERIFKIEKIKNLKIELLVLFFRRTISFTHTTTSTFSKMFLRIKIKQNNCIYKIVFHINSFY